MWSWRLEKAGGQDAGTSPETFPTQSDAESWLGEHWRTLKADGVDRVTLLEGDRAVYPMSLEEAS
ncbi:hypothetical protein [Actinomadura flavalba]|uniref:hypothetical protein n=1 Tax=Actinomadura flavalba TaxID=1120938 RepID=UPI00037F984C|nr:hypothetical protein [Actinomadura flavalba]